MGRTYNSTPVLSKIKIGANYYYVKDADARALLDSINDNVWEKLKIDLGSVATAGSEGLAVAKDVKTYVDEQITAIPKITYEIVDALPTASEQYDFNKTKKIYMVQRSGGAYYEYICVYDKAGKVYKWEKIGSTDIDLASYVKQVNYSDASHILSVVHGAGTETQVHTFGALADKSSASGTVAGESITGVKASYTPAGSVTISTAATAVTSSGSYTPEGDVTVVAGGTAVVTDGSINVTIRDEATDTDAGITREDYTPAGSVSVTLENNVVSEITSVGTLPSKAADVFVKPSLETGFYTAGDAATWTGKSFTKPTFAEGAFTPAAIQSGFYTAGSDASLSAGAQASLTDQAKSKFVKKAMNMEMGTGSDAECLIISEVATTDTNFYGDAVTDRGTFTANTLQTLTGGKATVIDTTKFSGGAKAADTFTQGEIDWGTFDGGKATVIDTTKFNQGSFTEGTFSAGTLPEKQNKTVGVSSAGFTGTTALNLKVTGVTYKKQEIEAATFSATKGGLSFTGSQATVTVAGNYDKVSGAEFTGTAGEAAVGTITVAAKTVTVQ